MPGRRAARPRLLTSVSVATIALALLVVPGLQGAAQAKAPAAQDQATAAHKPMHKKLRKQVHKKPAAPAAAAPASPAAAATPAAPAALAKPAAPAVPAQPAQK